MLRLWRLYRAAHGPGLDGIGGTFAAGRWHSRGERVVYFGASAGIVVLERLAHTDADLLPDDLRLGQFSLPDEAATAVGPLPDSWAQREAWSRRTGDLWLRGQASCVLTVPSALLPEETNYVLNPRHPAAGSLQLAWERAFTFDARLL